MSVIDPSKRYELEVHVTDDGDSWGLWQKLERMNSPTHWILVTTLERGRGTIHFDRKTTHYCISCLAGYRTQHLNGPHKGNNHLSHLGVGTRLGPVAKECCGTNIYTGQVGCIPTVA